MAVIINKANDLHITLNPTGMANGPGPAKDAYACSCSCRAVFIIYFVMPYCANPAHVSCHELCRAVPKKNNLLSVFIFFIFLRAYAKLLSYFF